MKNIFYMRFIYVYFGNHEMDNPILPLSLTPFTLYKLNDKGILQRQRLCKALDSLIQKTIKFSVN